MSWVCTHCGFESSNFLDPVHCPNCKHSYCFEKVGEKHPGNAIVDFFIGLLGTLVGAVLFVVGLLLWKSLPYLWRGLKKLTRYLWSKVHGFGETEEQS